MTTVKRRVTQRPHARRGKHGPDQPDLITPTEDRVAIGMAARTTQRLPGRNRPQGRSHHCQWQTRRANVVRTSPRPRASTHGSLLRVRSLRFAALSRSRRPGRARASRLWPRMVRRRSTVRVRQRAFEEGKSPEIGEFCCLAQHHRAPPHQHRDRYRARGATAKCLQTELLPGSTEPLRREGLDSVAVAVKHGKPLERKDICDHAAGARESWGQVLGTGGSSLGGAAA